MSQLSKAALACAVIGAVLVTLQAAFSVQTALAGLFVVGVACGIVVAGRMLQAQAHQPAGTHAAE
jgi:uncharacterized membrane protein YciS (DUF1049 family)